MNIYLLIIIIFLILSYLIGFISDYLNVKNMSEVLPKEFEGYYDAEKYKKSQNYLKDKTNFSFISSLFVLVTGIVFILAGGFNFVDKFARSFGYGEIVSGMIFISVLMLLLNIIKIPFSAYNTFVIEEKYGFNKTTIKTFISDIIKNNLLLILIGLPIFAVIVWFFMEFNSMAWVYAVLTVIFFELLFTFIAPVLIMPLFNKYIPLEDGELKTELENYAIRENFKMKGLFKMDGSKRSTKSNAFFTGFGKFRRIVLFDTLIEKHTTQELVSVLAHEMGHYKKGHINKFMIMSFLNTILIFFVLSFFIGNVGLFEAFSMEYVSVYGSLVFFGFLYTPISMVLSVIQNVISRKYEYESDRYAVETYKNPEAMTEALKKLSVDNLSNLTPHKLKVFMEYSHPPVLERIKAIKNIKI
ncbi:MAG: M48 family metallopeptidase [Endomicrobiaceae bacterium]|jgi:STE24 endopeptidase|nr:M48 family metallopeptidase [Endomicrobiaceae bacterium]MDD3730022.1 M48 family metallopeptidase [Endomicrobiaceae bacterium]MDD4166101.1 M48 family metallopeptidase [Endomicrobiaceae bacterium]